MVYLQPELGYGVTVALQILVLSVQVRILISQLYKKEADMSKVTLVNLLSIMCGLRTEPFVLFYLK